MPLEKTIPFKFIIFIVVFLLLDFVIENVNHKFQLNDFKVYYGAAQALTSGKQVYGTLFALGSGYYKYSPFTSLLFYPLTVLPYYVACIIDFLLISIAVVFTSVILLQVVNAYVFRKQSNNSSLILTLGIICISTHLVRELELGNVNVLLLFLLSFCLFYILQNKMIIAGILLALVIITKPFFILLFIPLLMHRYYKALFITSASLLLFLILPAAFFGFVKNLDLHHQWLNTMLTHAEAFPSPNTLDAMIRNHVSSSLSSNFQYIALLILLIPYILFIFRNTQNSKNNKIQKSSDLYIEWFTLIAFMPSIFKTDTEHFLMTLPILIFILVYLFHTKNILLSVLFGLLIILYAGNSSDILGKSLSVKVYDMGILGISNILIVAMGLTLYYTHSRKLITVQSQLN